jgi:hypothetical protein
MFGKGSEESLGMAKSKECGNCLKESGEKS